MNIADHLPLFTALCFAFLILRVRAKCNGKGPELGCLGAILTVVLSVIVGTFIAIQIGVYYREFLTP